MKSPSRICVVATVCLVAATALAQTQHIEPGEVPEGITAEDWGIVQEAYLKASNTDGGDSFGDPIAISGDTIVVGAPWEESNATGVNGDQSNNSVEGAGAAYVFVRSGTTWTQQAYLKASNTDERDLFGNSVAIEGDTIVVGAAYEDSSATGVNGDQTDNSAINSGAAYVFVRNGTTWSQQAFLKASDTGAYDAFGYRVAIFGDTIVIGAHWENSAATGVNGDQTDNSEINSGAAYVFVRNGTTWSQQAYLKASNTDAGDWFGVSVAISGGIIVIGADREASSAIGVNGNQADNSSAGAGAAYVFARNGTTWSQQAYLKASNTDSVDIFNPEAYFGLSVAISSDTIVVGATAEDGASTGVNGNQYNPSSSNSGAAYVFVRNESTWTQQAYLKASNTDAWDGFGGGTAISGETIIVSASGEDSAATGVNGNQADNSSGVAGAAYVYARNGITWTQQAYLKASNTGGFDIFGGSVAISSDTIVVGAPSEDSNATGVNGDQSDNSAVISGAAYVFTGFGAGDYQATITNCYPVVSGFVLEWIPAVGWNSVVQCSTDLALTRFTDLSVALPYPVNIYTDTVTGAESKCFYRVDLDP